MEKKLWRLVTPSRAFSGRQDLRTKSGAGQSRRRVSSVYLSDSTYTSDFIVIPEFDDPTPAITSSGQLSPNGDPSYLYDPESVGSHDDSYPSGSCYTCVSNTNYDDDLSRRLGFAYQYIRSMLFSASPTHLLSPDPQIIQKQPGIPQHSVFNHPVHSSPDLPNPHPFIPESTSPKLPSAAPPDVAHANPPKKLDLCIKTTVYPIPPLCDSPDSFEAVQRTGSTSVDSSSQFHTPETRWSPQITCALNTQPSDFKPSKLVKRSRGVEKSDITPSSLPSSCPQASRGVFRKQAVDTPRTANTHRCQTSLLEIRPPSPFKVDIPLHHAWHDRRTDFNSSSVCHSKPIQLHETRPRRASGNTEILASLAWIGTPSMTPSSPTANSACPPETPIISPDRFSMAIAVEDDSISDDALVDRLERVRKIGRSSDSERARKVSTLRSLDSTQSSDVLLTKPCDVLPLPLITQAGNSDSEDTEVWRVARRALLCIREIVRTEKRYQDAIRMLLNAQTTTPPPPSMVPYISALFRVSETLLRCYFGDPSAWGVSTAFVASEDELETTMVSWCSVAGAFFMDGNDPRSSGLIGKWRLRKSGVMTSPPSTVKQTSVAPNTRLPLMFPGINTTTKIKDEGEGARQRPPTEQEPTYIPLRKPAPERRNSQTLSDQSPSRKSSVRDLAIQPIQRVMRYVLLYRDLLECTPPTSPSYLLVGRALEAATRIANHCDRVQRNPAFKFVHAS